MGNKASILRSSSRADDSGTPRVAAGGPATSAAVADFQQPGAPPSGTVAKLLATNIASIRPNGIKDHQRNQGTLAGAVAAQKEKDNQFTRILLKFPQAAVAFNSARSTFNAFDKESKGYIEFSDLSRVFEQLGANFSAEEIGQVFEESDMMEDGKLNFNEFLVCLAIGFVLHLCVAAGTSDDSSNRAIWEQRFMEMDWNGDGTIHFKEFLMAFESWVGLEEEM
ncbi:EF-hand domain pair [Phytophthora cactorum]|nr:EF-hand domain pair [Phytophthora cactorum]